MKADSPVSGQVLAGRLYTSLGTELRRKVIRRDEFWLGHVAFGAPVGHPHGAVQWLLKSPTALLPQGSSFSHPPCPVPNQPLPSPIFHSHPGHQPVGSPSAHSGCPRPRVPSPLYAAVICLLWTGHFRPALWWDGTFPLWFPLPIHTPELQVTHQGSWKAAPGLRWGRGELKWTVLGMGGDPRCTEVTSHWGSGDIGANPGPATDSPCDLGQQTHSHRSP